VMKGFGQRLADAAGAAGHDNDFSGYLHGRSPVMFVFQFRTRSRIAV
jgi:hypothetical protein